MHSTTYLFDITGSLANANSTTILDGQSIVRYINITKQQLFEKLKPDIPSDQKIRCVHIEPDGHLTVYYK